jgi:hypothetical protein
MQVSDPQIHLLWSKPGARRPIGAMASSTLRWHHRAARLQSHLVSGCDTTATNTASGGLHRVVTHDDDDAVRETHRAHLFAPGFAWTPQLEAAMALDGHVVLPGLMTDAATRRGLAACARVQAVHDAYTAAVTPEREALAAR